MNHDKNAPPPHKAASSAVPRKKRLLWANVYCLLDTSSGAAMAVRQMLLQLQSAGWAVDILGAAVFDHARGTAGLQGQWAALRQHEGSLVNVEDGTLVHRLLVTSSTDRGAMTNREEGAWFGLYEQALELERPDVVFYYGGQPFDFLIASEAARRGVPVVFYLANGNYTKKRWCQDVDLILTDSQATASLYKQRLGVDVVPVGAFIDPNRVVAAQREPERLLFINPKPEKGALWVARLALWLEQHRPDIVLEVVESRGQWSDAVRTMTHALGQPRDTLRNVVVTANTSDMRPIYARARVVLAPSLWWESAGRVLAEAMLNGIPAICTNRGGMPEMVGDAGILLNLPEKYHQTPYNALPAEDEVTPLGHCVVALWNDTQRYEDLMQKAFRVGKQRHSLQANTVRLLRVLDALLGPAWPSTMPSGESAVDEGRGSLAPVTPGRC